METMLQLQGYTVGKINIFSQGHKSLRTQITETYLVKQIETFNQPRLTSQ